MGNIKNLKNQNDECQSFGFYQKNYFCDICEMLEPKIYLSCLKNTKENILNGKITEEDIKEVETR